MQDFFHQQYDGLCHRKPSSSPKRNFCLKSKKNILRCSPKTLAALLLWSSGYIFNASEKRAVQGTKTCNRVHNCLGSHGIGMIVVIIEIFLTPTKSINFGHFKHQLASNWHLAKARCSILEGWSCSRLRFSNLSIPQYSVRPMVKTGMTPRSKTGTQSQF